MNAIIVKNMKENYAELSLTTLENREFELVYSAVGIIDRSTNQHYETFENFLRVNSPLYTERFNKILMEKLQKLQKER